MRGIHIAGDLQKFGYIPIQIIGGNSAWIIIFGIFNGEHIAPADQLNHRRHKILNHYHSAHRFTWIPQLVLDGILNLVGAKLSRIQVTLHTDEVAHIPLDQIQRLGARIKIFQPESGHGNRITEKADYRASAIHNFNQPHFFFSTVPRGVRNAVFDRI